MIKTKPLVSICCITYNHEKFIEEALEGFLMQETNFEYEILIHDDASTDKTKSIIESYVLKHPEVVFPIFQKENQYSLGVRGIMARYNFPRAKGKYVALCEGDDYWTDPLKLQKQVDFLEKNKEINICFHSAQVLKNNILDAYEIPEPFETKAFEYIELLKYYNFIATASIVFRKPEELELPKWYYELPFGDLGLYKIISDNKKIQCINEFMSVYRVHHDGVYSKLSQAQARYQFLRFYKTIFNALNKKEKSIVKEKLNQLYLDLASLRFKKWPKLQVGYYWYLRFKF
ncbi:glycosyltransferase family 2 protein [Aestuariivivens marinum]|uniref:glycosyltransferase family 2 protein n=1 Tax=Aestuariivivens marinum TaxID=2913555 RepID=UPI001F5ADC2D|nr:glycosyltransferase [Aestuariivivens marinum]